MINVSSYGALALGESFTYTGSWPLPPVVFDDDSVLFCAKSAAALRGSVRYPHFPLCRGEGR